MGSLFFAFGFFAAICRKGFQSVDISGSLSAALFVFCLARPSEEEERFVSRGAKKQTALRVKRRDGLL